MKYSRVSSGQDRIEVKSIIGLVLTKRNSLKYLHDVQTERSGTRHLKSLFYYVKLRWLTKIWKGCVIVPFVLQKKWKGR